MGEGHSKSHASEPPPLLPKPWREINWGDKQSALQFVKNFKPHVEGQQIRILLYGPAGAGKSSFINTVQSILRGRMYTQALADNVGYDSFTKRYTTYKIPKKDPQSFYPFVFSDIMGLEPIKGVHVDDVKLALKGRVMDGYRFNPESRLSEDDQYYNSSPADNDKVHVLVCVIPANTVSQINYKVVQKIRNIRMEASDLDIPQVVIVTKIDEACPEIKEDLQNAYKVKYMKEKMEQISIQVGIPRKSIFPVKNYHNEVTLNGDIDSLILSAMKHIITTGENHINFKKSQSESSGTWA